MAPLAIFLWAAGGSLALEVISLFNEIKAEKATGLPAYYKNPIFWIVRIAVTAIAGGLAIAEEATRPMVAINIGASAPAILQLLTNPPRVAPARPTRPLS
jgi:hypothetical protein